MEGSVCEGREYGEREGGEFGTHPSTHSFSVH